MGLGRGNPRGLGSRHRCGQGNGTFIILDSLSAFGCSTQWLTLCFRQADEGSKVHSFQRSS